MTREKPEKTFRYLNRELSWLEFNRRVLEEAANLANPLLERLRFLAIFEANLDEFYMVRVSGLIEQFENGVLEASPDGLSPNEQLVRISETAEPLRQRASELFESVLRPELVQSGIAIRTYESLTSKQQSDLDDYFMKEVFPLCTPLILHPAPSVPFISNRSLNLAVELSDGANDVRLGRVKIPTVIRRAIRLNKRRFDFVLLEDLLAHHLQALFPGVSILGSHLFRVIRDADVEIREFEAADLLATVEETIRMRRFGDPVLLQHAKGMPNRVRKILMTMLKLDTEDVFQVEGILGMELFHELAKIDKPALRFPPHLPYVAEPLSSSSTLFSSIAHSDVLVHHPFDGFRSVETFVASAASDENVVGIKQTLYRVGTESPIVDSLLEAAGEGKQVAAMVELKARFDESNNLVWARALERAGVHLTYGFPEMKTHCKLALIVRRERGGMKSYAHIGTGNYNPVTARQYTDLGLFTCDPEITQDISELFNYLTGYSKQTTYRKLLVAPLNLREGILSRIQREIDFHKLHGNGRIVWKLNALVDPEIVDALYAASSAGLRVELIVRGVCCLRPASPGLSDNIQVKSVIGRFLEHSRIYLFGNNGETDVLIGSADAMRRNLDRRIEVLVPVADRRLVDNIDKEILDAYLRDTDRSWLLEPAGTYRRVVLKKGQKPFDSQLFLMRHPGSRLRFGR